MAIVEVPVAPATVPAADLHSGRHGLYCTTLAPSDNTASRIVRYCTYQTCNYNGLNLLRTIVWYACYIADFDILWQLYVVLSDILTQSCRCRSDVSVCHGFEHVHRPLVSRDSRVFCGFPTVSWLHVATVAFCAWIIVDSAEVVRVVRTVPKANQRPRQQLLLLRGLIDHGWFTDDHCWLVTRLQPFSRRTIFSISCAAPGSSERQIVRCLVIGLVQRPT